MFQGKMLTSASIGGKKVPFLSDKQSCHFFNLHTFNFTNYSREVQVTQKTKSIEIWLKPQFAIIFLIFISKSINHTDMF